MDMKKIILAAAAAFITLVSLSAREDRNFVQGLYNSIEDKSAVFKVGGEWFPYPEYTDREAWDKLTVDHKKLLVKNGEKYLRCKWQNTRAYY